MNRTIALTFAALAGLILLAIWLGSRAATERPAEPTAPDVAAQVSPALTAVLADEPPGRLLAEAQPGAPAPAASDGPWLDVYVVGQAQHEPLFGVRLVLSSESTTSARTSVEHVDSASGDPERAPRTDEDGHARLQIAPDTKYVLLAVHEGSPASTARREVGPYAAGERVIIALELESAVIFHGRVLAREDDLPIIGAHVHVDDLAPRASIGEGAARADTLVDLETDAEGRFQVRLPSRNPFEGSVRAAGRSIGVFVIGPGHETVAKEKRIRLSRSATLRARVVRGAGKGIRYYTVRATVDATALADRQPGSPLLQIPDPQFAAETDSDGWCTLSDLPAECALAIELLLGGRSERKEREKVSLAPGEERVVTFELAPGVSTTISGCVVAEGGTPIGEEVIWLVAAERGVPGVLRHYRSRMHGFGRAPQAASSFTACRKATGGSGRSRGSGRPTSPTSNGSSRSPRSCAWRLAHLRPRSSFACGAGWLCVAGSSTKAGTRSSARSFSRRVGSLPHTSQPTAMRTEPSRSGR